MRPPARYQLKRVLYSLEFNNLEPFFEKMAKAEIERPSAKEVAEVMKLLDLKKLEACLKEKNPHFMGGKAWAEQLAGWVEEACLRKWWQTG